MSFKKGFGVLITVAIVIVVSIELWTVSTMFWTELVGKSTTDRPDSSRKDSNSKTFSLGSIEGRFEKFRLEAGEKDWVFQLRLQMKSITNDEVQVRVEKLRIGGNTTYPIKRMIDFKEKESQTISISQRIEPGTSPNALFISVKESGTSNKDWILLPKIPVRAVD